MAREIKIILPYDLYDEFEGDAGADFAIEMEDAIVGVLSDHEVGDDITVTVEWKR